MRSRNCALTALIVARAHAAGHISEKSGGLMWPCDGGWACGYNACIPAATCAHARAVLLAIITGLPPQPASEHTAACLDGHITSMQFLLEKMFGLANVPASKLLAVCYTNLFQCDAWGMGSAYFTCDEAKTWQMREAVVRSMRAAYSRLDMREGGHRRVRTRG